MARRTRPFDLHHHLGSDLCRRERRPERCGHLRLCCRAFRTFRRREGDHLLAVARQCQPACAAGWHSDWFFLFAGYALQTAGLEFTTSLRAALLGRLERRHRSPIILALLGLRRITGWVWAGAVAALAGLSLLTIPYEGISGVDCSDPLVFLAA